MSRCGICRGRGSFLETTAAGRIFRQTCYGCGGSGVDQYGTDSSGCGGCLGVIFFWIVVGVVCIVGLILFNYLLFDVANR
jgi:hypothetical protein